MYTRTEYDKHTYAHSFTRDDIERFVLSPFADICFRDLK